jgi:putative cardiolipin synthase
MTTDAALLEHRALLSKQSRQAQADDVDYVKRIAIGEPFNGIVSGRLPLILAHAQLLCDSPAKRSVVSGAIVGNLMHRDVAAATSAVQNELLMITPYLIPGDEGKAIINELRRRNVSVRILTNSLESSTVLIAQAGYMTYRQPLLASGVELDEICSLLGTAKGSGQTAAISRYGNYSLHAKLFVFDRQRVFLGSMNFDQRSMHLNTEIGLIIDSVALAEQIAARFEAMAQPANSYLLALRPNQPGSSPTLIWRTQEGSKLIEYETEPARSHWQRFAAHLFSVLPLDKEL